VSGFLLDTNIPSELIRSQPEPKVQAWVFSQDEQTLFLSAITIGELRRGFTLLQARSRRSQLERWLETILIPRFSGRVLPITHRIADCWGVLDAQRQLKGRPLNTADGLIAATALEHDLTLVTRNMRDFVGLDVKLLNPWEIP